MKVFLITPRGFCFGVKNALEMVEDVVLKYPDRSIYVYNEIVHNKTIVDRLKSRGVFFTQDVALVPSDAVVVFSAHGVSPAVRSYFQKKTIEIVDATCPIVAKVHSEVLRYVKEGYHIVFVGDPNHDEVIGIVAEAPESISIVKIVEDIALIERGHDKYVVLNQTTLNMFEVEVLFKKIGEAFSNVKFPEKSDICYATTSRQLAVKEAMCNCDAFVVIGSKNSSNSKKLRDVAVDSGRKAILVDNHQELDSKWLDGVETLCISAGASAPEHLVQDLVRILRERYGAELINEQ